MSQILQQKATAGPWFVGAQNDALFITAGKPPSPSNDYPQHDADRTVIAKVYDDANARLIAAAPELLAALIHLSNEAAGWRESDLREVGGNTNTTCLLRRIVEARAVIAKAEGSE